MKRNQYPHLTAPICIRDHVFKTRLIYPVAQPHFIQASEDYPAGQTISYYESRVRGKGAGLIFLHDLTNPKQRDEPLDCGHFSRYNLEDKGAQNGIAHFLGIMHLYGTFVTPEINMGRRLNLCCNDPAWGFVPDPHLPHAAYGPEDLVDRHGQPVPLHLDFAASTQMGFDVRPDYEAGSESAKEEAKSGGPRYITPEVMDELIAATIDHAKKWQSLGADGGYIDFANFPVGQFLRASFNQRRDEYGGSLENRIRFPVRFVREIRKAMGDHFLLIINSPDIKTREGDDGITLDELAVFVKAVEPYADLLQLRVSKPDHVPDDECVCAQASAYLKSQGVKMPIAIKTYFKRLDQMDAVLAEGKADFIAPGHMFICNENLGELIQQGRGEDANPCIECHCCRGTSSTGDWMSQCTINPEMGIEYRIPFLVRPVTQKKRVAIIGGGPGGMKCAMYLKDRGHEPVIFEKSDELGGQIKMANYAKFKWELLRYLDFLKEQVAKRGIEVRLNTTATPESIEAENFDTVVAACGASAQMPAIQGVENTQWDPINIYGREDQLGHTVVVIGGASSASEAAVHLSNCGHQVIQLCRRECIGYDLNPIRGIPYMNILANRSGVETIHRARTTQIEPGKVTYVDAAGETHTIDCDDVVAAGGMKPNAELAMSFADCAPEFYMIGDCTEPATMRHAIKDAYCTAMQI